MKKLLVILVAVCGMAVSANTQDAEQNTQWQWFKAIPKYKSISFKTYYGDNDYWTITITDKYQVSLSGGMNSDGYYSSGRHDYNMKCNGSGMVLWNDNQMQINLTIDAYGYYYCQEAQNDRFTGNDYKLDGNQRFNFTLAFGLLEENGELRAMLENKKIEVNVTGNNRNGDPLSRTVSAVLGDKKWVKATAAAKNASELNTAAGDEFGEWQWNKERTEFYLKSSSGNNKFVMRTENGQLSWSMEMEKGTKGVSESTAEDGSKLVNLSMQFDGAAAQKFSFVELENSSNVKLQYAAYNRLKGTMNTSANAILEQIKGKQMLLLQYKAGGEEKFDMFNLEGLETLMDNIK